MLTKKRFQLLLSVICACAIFLSTTGFTSSNAQASAQDFDFDSILTNFTVSPSTTRSTAGNGSLTKEHRDITSGSVHFLTQTIYFGVWDNSTGLSFNTSITPTVYNVFYASGYSVTTDAHFANASTLSVTLTVTHNGLTRTNSYNYHFSGYSLIES